VTTDGGPRSPADPSPLTGRSILITGATGSFGRAFVARALQDGARRVVAFSRDELKQSQMAAEFTDPRMRFFIGDVRSQERLYWAMKGVDTVVHAAAMKRIETCEANPDQAVEVNVLGSLNVAQCAIDAGVHRAVMLSTDKAPAAATLYGATKFCAERLWCASNVFAAGTHTRLSAVRYGNVIGSRGSVLDLFREQKAKGVPITLTSEQMTRFWITLDNAVDLVLLALTEMRGAEVFIPKAGSASILDFARAVVGPEVYEPGHVETGLRAQERLHETLISSDEARFAFDAGSHYLLEPEGRSWGDAAPLRFPKMPEGWSYRSDTNPQQLSVDELRSLIAA
jgi:UDP-N-acetylglucosamine 4,6-dehydratase/5-epimerase